jgi:hypothetical protein
MKKISYLLGLYFWSTSVVFSVPAAPHLMTFEQPDGTSFQGHLRGDEYFSWIETEGDRLIVVEDRSTGYFEFATIQPDASGKSRLAPSGLRVSSDPSSRSARAARVETISREQLGELWKAARQEKLKPILIVPASE